MPPSFSTTWCSTLVGGARRYCLPAARIPGGLRRTGRAQGAPMSWGRRGGEAVLSVVILGPAHAPV